MSRPFLRRLTGAVLIPIYLQSLLLSCGGPYSSRDDGTTDTKSRTIPGLPSIPPGSVEKAGGPIKLKGAGRVTDTGIATYSIPIGVPDGPRGMQPALSLTYGGNGNGHLGVGWALSGLSAITPCRKTFAADGTADGVDRDGTDAFCLDGQRLVPPGQLYAPSPAAGDTLYHTADESFRRIVAHADAAGGPMPGFFTVHERDGRVATYGPVRADVRTNEHAHSTPVITGRRIPAFYLLDTLQDLDGNLIRYRYEDADSLVAGELSRRIKSIEYAFDGATPTRKIEFAYESRPDPIIAFAGGMTTVVRSRLTSITTSAPNPTAVGKVWKYLFTYAQSGDTRRSLLQSVRLYDQFDVSSWVRSFSYSKADGGIAEHVAPELEFTARSMSWDVDTVHAYNDSDTAQWLPPTDVRVLLYDADADGDDDILYRTKASWVSPWSGLLHPPDGIGRWINHNSFPAYARFNGHIFFRRTGVDPEPGPRVSVSDQLEPGMDDIFEFDGFSIAHLGKSRVADTDGDGKLNLVLATTRVSFSGGWSDATTEYLDTWDYGFTNYVLETGGPAVSGVDTPLMHGTVVRQKPSHLSTLAMFTPPFQRVISDLDGDARPEALEVYTPPGGIDVTLDDGKDWNDAFLDHEPYGFGYHFWPTTDLEHALPSARWSCNNGHMIVADVDGDGRQDVLAAERDVSDPTHHNQGVYRKISLDDAIGNEPHGSVIDDGGTSLLWGGDCGAHDPDLVMGDWNGDGLVDALYPPGSYTDGGATPPWSSGTNSEPLVRWNFGNGFGPIESFSVNGASGITKLLRQDAPVGKFSLPVVWDRGTRTADVNGDGRTDIVAFRQNNTACITAPLLVGGVPTGWGCENKVVVFLSAGDHFEGKEIWSWPVSGANLAHGFTTAQVGDVTGDGALDVVHVADGHLTMLELPWRTVPDQLVNVLDESAAYPLETFQRTRAWWGDTQHSQSTNPPPCAWPLSCPRRGFEVVRTHRVFTGTRPDGSAMYSTDIHQYETPRESLLGRGSLGFFQHRIWNRERGSETVRVFQHAVADPFGATGYPPSLVFLFGGSLFYPGKAVPSLEYTVTPRIATPTTTELNSSSPAPGLSDGVDIPVRVVSTERTFEMRSNPAQSQITRLPETTTVVEVDNTATPDLSSAPMTPRYAGVDMQSGVDRRETKTTYQHDVLGNPISVTTTVRGAHNSPVAGTRRIEATYVACPGAGCPVATPGTWITGLPVRVALADFDANDPVLPAPPARVVRATYDAKGRPAQIRVNAAGAGYSSCAAISPDSETCEEKSTATTIGYTTPHGNVETTTQVAVDNPTPRTTMTTWDAQGVYPTSTVDPAGILRVKLLHPGLGVPVVALDANSVLSTAKYDGFGRVTTTSTTGRPTVTRSYSPVVNGNRRGLRVDTSSQAGSVESETTDELSRTIEASVRGFGAGETIVTKTEYDTLGRLVSQTRPSFVPGAPATKYRYDRLGRTTMKISPVNAVTETAHTMFSTTTTDPELHTTSVRKDIEGRVVESGHLIGTTPYGEVAFTYGLFDQVATITDAWGRVTTRGYDAFGRVESIVDPDTGTTTLG